MKNNLLFSILLILSISLQNFYAQTTELWGNAYQGGPLEGGTVFKTNENGSNIEVIKAFTSGSSEGFHIRGVISASNGKIYGLTERGGIYGGGTIFQIDPSTNSFLKLHDFHPNTEGSNPICSLMEYNGFLYGTLSQVGAYGAGSIFKFEIQTKKVIIAHHFYGGTGISPRGTLMLATNGFIYGTTVSGGSGSQGTLFQFNPINNTLYTLVNFNGSNGGNSHSNLVEVNGKLYGTNYTGGPSGVGNIFEYNLFPNGTPPFSIKANFGGYNGANPFGGLVKGANNQLYGLTFRGGIADSGILYQFDPVSGGFAKRADFTNNNGRGPVRNLTLSSDGNFYTTTYQGGVYDSGVIVRFNPHTNSFIKVLDLESNSTGRLSNESLTLTITRDEAKEAKLTLKGLIK